MEQQRAELGLDKPLPVRYGLWLKEIVTGNLGYSYSDRQPVADKISERIWPTLKLMLTVQLLALVIARADRRALGDQAVLAARLSRHRLRVCDDLDSIVFPGAGRHLCLCHQAALAAVGRDGDDRAATVVRSIRCKHLILPATVLGLAQAAPLIRYTRSSMLETDPAGLCARGARERALRSERDLPARLRNALIPLVTVVALTLPQLLGGTVIIEQIFAWPGMGTLAIKAVRGRDYPTIMAINLIGRGARSWSAA